MARESEEFDWTENDLQALEEIKLHEGYRPSKDGSGMIGYYDTNGYLTTGRGHLVKGAERREDLAEQDVPELYMTLDEADELFKRDYIEHRDAATRTPGWDKASPSQRRALINLTFNMGKNWWKSWKDFPRAASEGDWDAAADALVDSSWYEQVKSRGPEVVSMIRPARREEGGDETLIASLPGMWSGGLVGRARYT